MVENEERAIHYARHIMSFTQCHAYEILHQKGLVLCWKTFLFSKSKVAFIILSPAAIDTRHSTGLKKQFELFTIITQPIALMPVAACLASGRLCLFT